MPGPSDAGAGLDGWHMVAAHGATDMTTAFFTSYARAEFENGLVKKVIDELAAGVQLLLPGSGTGTCNSVTNGVARLDLQGWGAFTVGATTDTGRVQLELDLSQDASIPQRFRDR